MRKIEQFEFYECMTCHESYPTYMDAVECCSRVEKHKKFWKCNVCDSHWGTEERAESCCNRQEIEAQLADAERQVAQYKELLAKFEQFTEI